MTVTKTGFPRSNRPTAGIPQQALGIVIATMEAIRGRRPLHQIRPRMTRPAFESLVALLDDGRLSTASLGRITAQMPSPYAVEATVSIHVSGRWLACAVRLDGTRSGNWTCADVAVVGLA